MRLRHDKRIIGFFILPTVEERKRGKTRGKGEGPKGGLKDKI
jgi:hypothetical protein